MLIRTYQFVSNNEFAHQFPFKFHPRTPWNQAQTILPGSFIVVLILFEELIEIVAQTILPDSFIVVLLFEKLIASVRTLDFPPHFGYQCQHSDITVNYCY
jgi:hypothetical protein